MNKVTVKRWRQVAEFGWKDAQVISKELGGKKQDSNIHGHSILISSVSSFQ